MQTGLTAALVACFCVLAPASASAGELVTPLLDKETFDDFACMVYNGGPKPIDVTIEIFDAEFAASNAGPANRTIQPGRRARLVTSFGGDSLCRVTGKFSRKKTLVTFCVVPSGGGRCDSLVTVP